ncbi:hypothetical protein C0992_000820 [Termitomyces sp. T32_za158]|nr:hypothetical protein C0992_000820 [Termitomyces sp. T32_za158]
MNRPMGSASRGFAGLMHAPNAPESSKNHQGHKLPILLDNLEPVSFLADIPVWAEPAELLFIKAVVFPSPSSQLIVVKLTTNPRTPAQYNGLVATSAVGKEKQQAVPVIEDDSNYGQSHSKEEEEAKEGKTAMECFQRIQQNKKLTKKKVKRAKDTLPT